MVIKIRDPSCKTVKDVVLKNLNTTEDELFDTSKSYRIHGLTKAKALLETAANNGQTITILGDYDADGICATAILSLVFQEMGWSYVARLPHRFSEGYGLSENIIDEIDGGLLITVDNGITAIDAINKAKEKGLTVIVTDHHLSDADNSIPNADVVIDPNAIPNTADFNGYCGAGIAYKLAIEILGKDNPMCKKLLSLAAIATVADVMPLIEENREIVKDGLKAMLQKDGRTDGLGAILSKLYIYKYISAKDIGFKIGPIINAPGRMIDEGAQISLDVLTTEDAFGKANDMADTLIGINDERKMAKTSGLGVLEKNISDNNLSDKHPLIVCEEGLPEGLIGIFAGNLAEKYKTPCFVFTNSDEEGILKASARSYGSIHLKNLLDEHQELLEKYGGHAEAAGISIKKDNLQKFTLAMEKSLEGIDTSDDDTAYYDLCISANDIDGVVDELEKFGPFGQGNPEIVFKISNFTVATTTYMQNGLSVKLAGKGASALCFNMGEKYRNAGEPKIIDIVGTIHKSNYRNYVNTQIDVIDFTKGETMTEKTPMAELLAKMASERHI